MSKYHSPWGLPLKSLSCCFCGLIELWRSCLLIGRRARVTFSYKPEQEDELTLEVGDIITNIVDMDVGWCEGELNGKKGMFPNNFVEMIPASEEVVAPQPTTTTLASNEGLIISFVHSINLAFLNRKSVSFELKLSLYGKIIWED